MAVTRSRRLPGRPVSRILARRAVPSTTQAITLRTFHQSDATIAGPTGAAGGQVERSPYDNRFVPRNGNRKRPSARKAPARASVREIAKAPTGVQGLDEVTGGGLPRGRPTLVCGGPGSGKTLLAMEFIVKGAMEFDEPGVFVAFEETAEELTANVRSLGFDLDDLIEREEARGRLRPHRAQRDRGDRRVRPRGLFIRSATPSTRSEPSASSSTPSRPSSPASTTPRCCAPSCAGSSAGSRTGASPR